MKLRLNRVLRRYLVLSMVAFVSSWAHAGVMHPDVSIQTYTDFGQNTGRYVVGGKVNALLDSIRRKEGITVSYTDGQADRVVASYEQGMIDFSAASDAGNVALIGPNFAATVSHNTALDASYGGRVLGSDYATYCEAVHIYESQNFQLSPGADYALQRQSKIVTNVAWNPLYTLPNNKTEQAAIAELAGKNGPEGMLYHAGGGFMCLYDAVKNPNVTYDEPNAICDAHTYIIGSVDDITLSSFLEGNTNDVNCIEINPGGAGSIAGGATDSDPIPWGARRSDSGSGGYVYNSATGRYEYIAAAQSLYRYGDSSGSGSPTDARTSSLGAISWSKTTMDSFNAEVKMDGNTVYLNATEKTDREIKEGETVATTIYSGKVTDANGAEVCTYNGMESGKHTWADLSAEKDKLNWYAYSTYKVEIEGKEGVTMDVSYLNPSEADLFYSSNLVFSSDAGKSNFIKLNDTVDLGVGYAEFSGGRFYITAVKAGSLFNHAGYVINEGAEVHVELVNPADYMYEWRKIGAGNLYIDGKGDTNALLNVGGSGTTFLDQGEGYAAYNVLANTGATVQITGGVEQIKRDFTFGAGGGKLDMADHDMVWNNDNGAEAAGFTIHALTEEAVITNSTGLTTLTVTNAKTGVDDSTAFLGSFQDTATGALKVIYNGGAGSTWTLHSIHTDLRNNAGSGFEVATGTVVLSGSNTVHGMGSLNGMSAERATISNDWHYADAEMNVSVAAGATFELGSHARLIGDITVADGGTFVLHQSVDTQWEYIEGGAFTEDTYQYRDFYGLKGNVSLAGDKSVMRVQLGQVGEKVDSITEYAHSISGAGSLSISASSEDAALRLSGAGTYTGGTTLHSGTLIVAHESALGKGSVSLGANKLVMESNLTLDGALTADGATIQLGNQELKLNSAYNNLKDTTLSKGAIIVEKGVELMGQSSIQQVSSVTLAGTLSVSDTDKKEGITIAGNKGNAAQITNLNQLSRGSQTVTLSGTSDAGTVVSHALIYVQTGTTLNLSNAALTDTSIIRKGALQVSHVEMHVTEDANATSRAITLSAGTEMYQFGASGVSLKTETEANVLAITSSILDSVQVSGSSLTICLNGFDVLPQYELAYLSFKADSAEALFDIDIENMELVWNDKVVTSTAYYVTSNVGGAPGGIYFMIPEPATATLSLLALTGVLLRRRRK